MEKLAEISILLDIYGSMLTPKQRDIMDLYYNYDLTLAEIGENKQISRQGVHDIIKRSEYALKKVEGQLRLKKKYSYTQMRLKEIDAKLISLKDCMNNGEKDDKLIKDIIDDIRVDLRSIMENLTRQEDE